MARKIALFRLQTNLFRSGTGSDEVVNVGSDPPPKRPGEASPFERIPELDLKEFPDIDGNFEIVIRHLGRKNTKLPPVRISFLNATLSLQDGWLYYDATDETGQQIAPQAASSSSRAAKSARKAASAAESDPPVKPPKTAQAVESDPSVKRPKARSARSQVSDSPPKRPK